jgi:AcrR family transcriptional regulator
VYPGCMPRHYELKARAEGQAETRRRIVDAAIALHESLGPSRTTITAIAERAGVGRLSVYRHFPEEADLFLACSGRYWEDHPAPDPSSWLPIDDPERRLEFALAESYEYHRETAPMISRALADVGDAPHMAPYHEYWRTAADAVASARWGLRGRRRRILRASIGHALAFTTWQTLTRELTDAEAVSLMVCLVRCAAW